MFLCIQFLDTFLCIQFLNTFLRRRLTEDDAAQRIDSHCNGDGDKRNKRDYENSFDIHRCFAYRERYDFVAMSIKKYAKRNIRP